MTDALKKAKAVEKKARVRLIRACASSVGLTKAADAYMHAYMRALRLTERAKEGK